MYPSGNYLILSLIIESERKLVWSIIIRTVWSDVLNKQWKMNTSDVINLMYDGICVFDSKIKFHLSLWNRYFVPFLISPFRGTEFCLDDTIPSSHPKTDGLPPFYQSFVNLRVKIDATMIHLAMHSIAPIQLIAYCLHVHSPPGQSQVLYL